MKRLAISSALLLIDIADAPSRALLLPIARVPVLIVVAPV